MFLFRYVLQVPVCDVYDLDNKTKIRPEASKPYVPIYKWRLQQEHAMKAQNGGKGMTDEQVKKWVSHRHCWLGVAERDD